MTKEEPLAGINRAVAEFSAVMAALGAAAKTAADQFAAVTLALPPVTEVQGDALFIQPGPWGYVKAWAIVWWHVFLERRYGPRRVPHFFVISMAGLPGRPDERVIFCHPDNLDSVMARLPLVPRANEGPRVFAGVPIYTDRHCPKWQQEPWLDGGGYPPGHHRYQEPPLVITDISSVTEHRFRVHGVSAP